MAIFVHRDCDGDELEVSEAHEDWSERHSGSLAFMVTHHSNEQTSALPRDRVRSLRDALNRWLDEQQSRDPNPAGSNTAPPYETLVRQLVAEEVARVMPLHQSPQAAMVPEPQHASNTGLALCLDPFCTKPRDHAEHDPEPQAVGHPEAPGIDWTDKSGVRYEYCTECGHSWSRHGVGAGNCNVLRVHARGGYVGCGCEAIRADQVQTPVPSRYDGEGEPVKAECTCRRHEHRPGATRRCAYPGCFCRRQS